MSEENERNGRGGKKTWSVVPTTTPPPIRPMKGNTLPDQPTYGNYVGLPKGLPLKRKTKSK